MAHVCGDLIKMQGRNSLDSLSTVFHLESVLEADLVSKDRDLCAQQSAKSLVITLLEARGRADVTHNVYFFKTNIGKEQRQIQTICVEKYCQQKHRAEPRTGGS